MYRLAFNNPKPTQGDRHGPYFNACKMSGQCKMRQRARACVCVCVCVYRLYDIMEAGELGVDLSLLWVTTWDSISVLSFTKLSSVWHKVRRTDYPVGITLIYFASLLQLALHSGWLPKVRHNTRSMVFLVGIKLTTK